MDIFDQLSRDEGRSGSAYQDSLGFWTIGIGTCIDARKGCALTDAEIDLLCHNRIAHAQQQLEETFPWISGLDDVRLGVLLNMTYQMGVHGVAEFHNMLDALQKGDYAGASAAMLDSAWAHYQSPARAQRLALQMSGGEWQ